MYTALFQFHPYPVIHTTNAWQIVHLQIMLQGEFHFESIVLLDLVKDVINKIILL